MYKGKANRFLNSSSSNIKEENDIHKSVELLLSPSNLMSECKVEPWKGGVDLNIVERKLIDADEMAPRLLPPWESMSGSNMYD